MRRVVVPLTLLLAACGSREPDAVAPVALAPAPPPPPSAAPAPTAPPRPDIPSPNVPLADAFRDRLMDEISTSEPDGQKLHEAFAAERSHDMNDARKRYFELVQKFPASPVIPYAYLAFADTFAAESKHDLARTAYQEVLKYPPPKNRAYAYAWLRLGEVYLGQHEAERALDAARKAIQAVASDRTTPEAARVDVAARETLVSAYAEGGRPDRAHAFFAGLPGGAPALLAALARTLDQRGDVGAAAVALESGLDAGRDDAVCAAVARLLAAHGTSAPGSAAANSLPRLEARRRAVCGP